MVLWFLCQGTPEGSTGNGSGFKASQKTGHGSSMKVKRIAECSPWSILQYF